VIQPFLTRASVRALFFSLTLTLILELGFLMAMGKRSRQNLTLIALVNMISNPMVVSLYRIAFLYSAGLVPQNTCISLPFVLALLELCAVAFEAACYRRFGDNFNHPFALSLCANLFSFLCGILLQLLI